MSALLVALGLALAVLGGTARPATADVTGTAWGAFVQPRDGLSGYDSFLQLEGESGRQLMASRAYHDLDSFQLGGAISSLVSGRGGVVYVGIDSAVNGRCVSWAGVAAGNYDSYLNGIAAQMKSFGGPVFFSWNHEMPVNCNTGTPADYIASWTHVRSVLIRDGATNVKYVWTPIAYMFRRGTAAQYEPPTAEFDYVGVDGYNKARAWRTPDLIFGAAHDFAVAAGKPLFVAEIGCEESSTDPSAKAAWITSASQLFSGWGDVKAVIWTNAIAKADYNVDTSAQSLAAFRTEGQFPMFQAGA